MKEGEGRGRGGFSSSLSSSAKVDRLWGEERRREE